MTFKNGLIQMIHQIQYVILHTVIKEHQNLMGFPVKCRGSCAYYICDGPVDGRDENNMSPEEGQDITM